MELLYSLVTIHSGLLNGLIPPCGVAGNESNLVPRLFIRKKKKKKRCGYEARSESGEN